MDQLYKELVTLIETETKEPGKKYTYGKFTGLGWLFFPYKCATYEGPYPRISIKQYDKTVNIYIMLWIDGNSVVENYTTIFGKTMVGKSCIRIKKLNSERIAVLRELIQTSMKIDNN